MAAEGGVPSGLLLEEDGPVNDRTLDVTRHALIPKPSVDDVPLPEKAFDPRTRSPLGMYFKSNSIQTNTFARLMGVSFRTIEAWAHGTEEPSLAAAYEIERITKGVIPMEVWLGLPTAKGYLAEIRAKQAIEVRNRPDTFASPAEGE